MLKSYIRQMSPAAFPPAMFDRTRALTLLVLTAFMLRALVPTGWMPQGSSSDGVTLIICTVAGLERITLGPDGHPQPSDDTGQASGNDVCPFAATATFTPPALAALLLPSTALAAPNPFDHAPAAPAATHLRLAESRAPPVSG